VTIPYVINFYFENAISFNYHFPRVFQHFKDNLIWTKFGPSKTLIKYLGHFPCPSSNMFLLASRKLLSAN